VFEQLNPHIQNLIFALGVSGLVIAYAAGVAWVYSDAETNRGSSCLWLLLSFFTGPLGILLYFLTSKLPNEESED
jgi:hypothetical protein